MKKRYFFHILTAVFILIAYLPVLGQSVDWSTKPLQSERSRSYDALHYLIKIRLDLERKTFEGETTIIASSLREALTTCVLDAEEFVVTSVLDASGQPLAFEQTPTELVVHLSRPFRFGEEFTFNCFYHGQDPKIGLKFVEESADNPRLVYSDSWPNNVHHWFPCFDYPNDKATNEIVATVKRGLKAAANGRLVSVIEDKAAGTVTYHWLQDQPHSTYLIFLAAAPYVVVNDFYKTLPISYWVYPQDEAKVGPTYGKTPRMIEFFNRVFSYDYPWRKYDQISVPLGGGAESTSATAMTHQIMVDEHCEPDFTAIGIVSHELSHQWWGDLVTLRSWAQAWINEGFATYSDYLYHRYQMGEDEGALNLKNKLDAYLREAHTRYIRPIVTNRYQKPADMFDAHSYQKAACVIHMLRSLVGEEPFFKIISHFLHNYAFDVVDTGDFIRSVKTVTGQNLDWFFDQWLFMPGHPVFEVRSEWDEEAKVVRLQVRQVQDFSRGVPVFRVPVSIKLVTARTTEIRKIWVERQEETFEFPLTQKPLLVRFDSDNVLIKEITFPREVDELIFQLKNDDVIGRMDAASVLVAFGRDPRAVAALVSSLQTDPFWAVRKSALESLAKIEPKDGKAIFLRARQDSHSKVRAAAIAVLGDLKDRKLLELYKETFRKDPSYLVKAEALKAIGKLGDPSTASFLRQAATLSSYRNMVARAAEAALKLIGNHQ